MLNEQIGTDQSTFQKTHTTELNACNCGPSSSQRVDRLSRANGGGHEELFGMLIWP